MKKISKKRQLKRASRQTEAFIIWNEAKRIFPTYKHEMASSRVMLNQTFLHPYTAQLVKDILDVIFPLVKIGMLKYDSLYCLSKNVCWKRCVGKSSSNT